MTPEKLRDLANMIECKGALSAKETAEHYRAFAAALEEIERLKANRDNWMESCKVAQGHRDGANAQILLLEQEVERLKGYLCAIFNKLDTYPPHAPGHCHSTPGIWDADNDSAIAGKGCEWCAKWGEIRGTLRADKGE